MELLHLLLSFILLLLPFALTLTPIIRKRIAKAAPQTLPPGSLGWPLIGETLDFMFNKPDKFILHRMRKYSQDIFITSIFGHKTAVICGPNGHKLLFSNEQKLFTPFRLYSMQKLFHSSESTKPSSANAHSTAQVAENKKIIKSPGFLRPEALVKYLGVMDLITQNQLDSLWVGKYEVKVFPFAKTLTLSLACRFFMGTDDPKKISRLVDKFDDVTLGLHSIVLNIPGTAFHKANKAAVAIRKELRDIINDKKAAIENGAPKQDLLSHMIDFIDTSGKCMPEAEIADKLMGFLVAGYSTVATAITFFMKYVAENPYIYNNILAEQLKVLESKNHEEVLHWDDIQKMRYSWNVLQEVLRLAPPLQGTFRETLTEVTYSGFTIPKGWKVYWTVSSTNMDPQYFPDPEIFDPSRHDGESRDAAILPPYAFVPFGGGPHMCPGKEYARLAILTFIHNVVKRFKWELVIPNEKIIYGMMSAPQSGLPVRLHPR